MDRLKRRREVVMLALRDGRRPLMIAARGTLLLRHDCAGSKSGQHYDSGHSLPHGDAEHGNLSQIEFMLDAAFSGRQDTGRRVMTAWYNLALSTKPQPLRLAEDTRVGIKKHCEKQNNNNEADCVSDLFRQSFACNHAYYLAFKVEDRNAVTQKATQG
ncbi:MAG TPA: hypothetical protein VMT08_06345 [Bradyrhizobium sp.]|nr:hypothetical protein [Bradyrhizobium sp.]